MVIPIFQKLKMVTACDTKLDFQNSGSQSLDDILHSDIYRCRLSANFNEKPKIGGAEDIFYCCVESYSLSCITSWE